MQKFLALLFAVTALLGLAGCGSEPDSAAETNPPTVYDGTGGLGGYGGPDRYDDNAHMGGADIPVTPYDDMVENGRVRDTDGILSDGENPQN